MSMVQNPMINMNIANYKDSRWLTLEVCREFQRNKCTRPDTECKFAHPPPHVEVQNGRVTCCFDFVKGKCQRKDPPCKYLHPPQHLREQLLQNGKNNLILKNLQLQMASYGLPAAVVPSMVPFTYDTGAKTAVSYAQTSLGSSSTQVPQYSVMAPSSRFPLPSDIYNTQSFYSPVQAPFNPYTLPVQGVVPSSDAGAVPANMATVAAMATPVSTAANKVTPRPDRLETNNEHAPQTQGEWTPHMDGHTNAVSGSDIHTEIPTYLGMTMPTMMPMMKRSAIADPKSGLPVYQPQTANLAAYQLAAAAQLQQQQVGYVPGTWVYSRNEVAGHHPSLPRF